MELNQPLTPACQTLLRTRTADAPLYCAKTDIDKTGQFGKTIVFGATRDLIFLFEDEHAEFFPLSSCTGVRNENQVNGGAMVLTIGGDDRLVLRYSMRELTRFSYIARGIELLREGHTKKRVESRENERVCPTCGRALPGTRTCPKCDKSHRLWRRLASLCRPYRHILVLVLISMLVESGLTLFQQYVLRYFVDRHFVPHTGTAQTVLLFSAILLGLTLTGIVLSIARKEVCSRLGNKIALDLRGKMMTKLQELSLSFMDKYDPGTLIGRVTGDTDRVRQFMEDTFCFMFAQLVTLVALSVLMLCMNVKLALAAFAFAPLIVIAARTFWPYIHRLFDRQWRKYDTINNKLQDILSGIRVVKVFGREKSETSQFSTLNADFARTVTHNELFFATFYPLLTLLLGLGSYLIIYVGGADVLRGEMSIGTLVQFTAYAGMLLGPLSWMTFLPRRLVEMSTSMERLSDILDETSSIPQKALPETRDITGTIVLDHVSFGYRSYERVLEDISLTVKSGEMIGLVGTSGCGKSTLINLIMRLYDVDEGTITVDGTDIRDFAVQSYHRQIGVVLQETFLFAGTILENIRFAKPDATPEEVILAAKRANAHEFICRLPDGYNTYIGERGHNLSGGERQRIAIARAILNDPRILILDEATSSLDTESEYQVQEALERLRAGRTTFAIAHRLSTLRSADRIVVIDDHRIREVGTHNELLSQKGIYYHLVMAQLSMSKTAAD